MITQKRSIRLILACVTLAATLTQWSTTTVLAQSSGCNTNDPDALCFANNPDLLGGQQAHNLLQIDDLALLRSSITTDDITLGSWQLNTTDSTLASPINFLSASIPYNSTSIPITAIAVGRMYNVGKDTVVAAAGIPGTPNAMYYQYIDGQPLNAQADQYLPSSGSMIMADFNGDGFSDLFTSGAVSGTNFMRLSTAQDVNTPFILKHGPLAQTDQLYDAVAGDFNGDGQLELAGLYIDSSEGNLFLGIYTVDPTTLSITPAASLQIPFTFGWDLTKGRFGTLNYDQLAMFSIHDPVTGDCCLVQTYDFTNGSLQPIPKGSIFVDTPYIRFMQRGRFIPGAYDQVVTFAAATNSQPVRTANFGVLTFSRDSNLIPSFLGGSTSTLNLNVGCPIDMAVGNFDRMQSDGQYDPNLNVAIAGTDCQSNTNAKVQVFTVDSDDQGTSVSYNSGQTLSVLNGVSQADYFELVAGDLQGRSIPLGQPEKATVTGHIQPNTILGVPPMHVDWITPSGGSTPSILNVSVFTQTFYTGYDFASTTGTQTSRQTTTSYTTAYKVSTNEKISYGVPKVSEISGTFKLAVTDKHAHNVDKTYNTNQGESYKLTANTVFDDLVAATVSQMNIYSYPVLGQCTDAPGAQPLDGCPADMAPLHVQFSGPDNVTYLDLVTGRSLEWYQPVHEPGNLFSYPGNLAQLEANQPQQPTADGETASSLQLLSPNNNLWDSQSTQQVSISWTQGAGSDLTTGTTDSHTVNGSVTVAGVKKFGFGSLSFKDSFDYNHSKATSTLNQSSSTYSESAGVLLNRGITGGAASSSNYLYQGQAFIFGQYSPLGTIQTDIPQTTDIMAQGFLTVGYAANPLSTGAIQSGNFWKQAYTVAPDVALNHPQRWLQNSTPQVQQVQFNCPVGFVSSFDQPACTSIEQEPTPRNIAAALFYQMKGLFVTPGDTTDGSPTTQAIQGDTLTLRARVYNYSLANMPDDAEVRVQFYAQPWDATAGQFLSESGNPDAFAPAVFIGEDVLAPVPAFCGGVQGSFDPCAETDAPRNWAFAQTTWDTSTVDANTDWIFWVVVWMESFGQMVSEIQGHGLTDIPDTMSLNSLADVPIETYSNNLGFYNQVFHVGSTTSALQSNATSRRLESTWMNPPLGAFLQHQLMTVRTRHRAIGAALDDVMVLYYDGDPAEEGKLFDMELIPHINADSSFVTRVPFIADTCGARELFVQAIPADGRVAPATDAITVVVNCSPLSVSKIRGKAKNVGSGIDNGELQVRGEVQGVSHVDVSTATLWLVDLLRESKRTGSDELVRLPLLPLRLIARPGSTATAAIFETAPSAEAPQVQVKLKRSHPNQGGLKFSINIERAVIKDAQLCGRLKRGSTKLLTGFSLLTDDVHEPIEVKTEQIWQCKENQLKTP